MRKVFAVFGLFLLCAGLFAVDVYFYKDPDLEEFVSEGEDWAIERLDTYNRCLEIIKSTVSKKGINIKEIERNYDESGFPFVKYFFEETWDDSQTLEVEVELSEREKRKYALYFNADKKEKREIAGIYLSGLISSFSEKKNSKNEKPPVIVDSFTPAELFGKRLPQEDRKAYVQQSIAGKDDYSFAFCEGRSLRHFDSNGNLKSDLSSKISEPNVLMSNYWNVSYDGTDFVYGHIQSENVYYFDDSDAVRNTQFDYQKGSPYLFRADKNGNPYLLPFSVTESVLKPGKDGVASKKIKFTDSMHNLFLKSGGNGTFWKVYNIGIGADTCVVLVYSKDGKLIKTIFPDCVPDAKIAFIFDDNSFIVQTKSSIMKFDYDGNKIWTMELPSKLQKAELYDVRNGMYYFIRDANGLVTRYADSSAKLPEFLKTISECNQKLLDNPKDYSQYLKIAETYEKAGGTWLSYENYSKYLSKSSGNPKAIEKRLLSEIKLEKALANELSEATFNSLDEYGVETARPKYQEAMRVIERLKKLAPNDQEIISMYADLKREFEPDSAVSSKIPSLKVESVEISPIFPAKLNVYSRNPNGIAYLSNPTNKELSNVKLSAYIRKYMDFPSETESFNLKAGASEVPVQFLTQINASTLSLSEDASVQMQISLSWDEEGKRNTLVLNRPVTIYRKTAMIWEDSAMLSCFISPNDSSVSDFIFANLGDVKKIGFINQNFSKALLLSNALGSIPLNYVSDPVNPTEDLVGNAFAIDTVRFPSETLAKKGGDCDDMTVLFCSVMESAGVHTGIVTTPGHVFAAFDSGFKTNSALGKNKELRTIEYDGKVWVPVEITALSSGFFEAWKKASSECFTITGDLQIEELKIVSKSRNEYPSVDYNSKPVNIGTLSYSKMNEVSKEKVIASLTESLLPVKTLSKNAEELNAAAKLYYLIGDNESAVECLNKSLAIDSKNPKTYKNLATIHKSKGDTVSYKLYLSKAKSFESGNSATSIASAGNSSNSETRASDADKEELWED